MPREYSQQMRNDYDMMRERQPQKMSPEYLSPVPERAESSRERRHKKSKKKHKKHDKREKNREKVLVKQPFKSLVGDYDDISSSSEGFNDSPPMTLSPIPSSRQYSEDIPNKYNNKKRKDRRGTRMSPQTAMLHYVEERSHSNSPMVDTAHAHRDSYKRDKNSRRNYSPDLESEPPRKMSKSSKSKKHRLISPRSSPHGQKPYEPPRAYSSFPKSYRNERDDDPIQRRYDSPSPQPKMSRYSSQSPSPPRNIPFG